MTLTEDTAFALAEELSTIPECARSDAAIRALGKDLLRLCKSEEEAVWLVQEARDTWKDWQGTYGLIQSLKSYRPASEAQLQRTPPICSLCTDKGYRGEPGHYVWCNCLVGRTIRANDRLRGDPDVVEQLNEPEPEARKAPEPEKTPQGRIALVARQRGMPGPHTSRPMDERPKTEDDLELDFQRRQARTADSIAASEAILDDPDTSKEQKEIARMNLRVLRGATA